MTVRARWDARSLAWSSCSVVIGSAQHQGHVEKSNASKAIVIGTRDTCAVTFDCSRLGNLELRCMAV